jgi:thiopurine S-methyltransferase
MDARYWIDRWNEGKTGFHQAEYHPRLVEFFPALSPKEGQSVLVPLCGKSKDLLWLNRQGLSVHGVELFQPAVEAFFEENRLQDVQSVKENGFIHFSSPGIRISCGDFFALGADSEYDFVYDRAALVALPESMRKRYVEVVQKAIKRGGVCLLIVYDYDQTELEGPPFSIGDAEVRELYSDGFSIELLSSEPPKSEGPRMEVVTGLRERVYSLVRE